MGKYMLISEICSLVDKNKADFSSFKSRSEKVTIFDNLEDIQKLVELDISKLLRKLYSKKYDNEKEIQELIDDSLIFVEFNNCLDEEIEYKNNIRTVAYFEFKTDYNYKKISDAFVKMYYYVINF